MFSAVRLLTANRFREDLLRYSQTMEAEKQRLCAIAKTTDSQELRTLLGEFLKLGELVGEEQRESGGVEKLS